MADKDTSALHHAYLDAMGVQLWQRRQVVQAAPQVPSSPTVQVADEPTVNPILPVATLPPRPIRLPADWGELEMGVAHCQVCELHQQRTHAVLGAGSRSAAWMFVGEAPGADEDQQGEPFVGKAGQLFNLMLNALGLARQEVYMTNIVKCRPPGNRDPHVDELASCSGYLQQQVALVKPRIIVAVGRIAAHSLLHNDLAVGVLRGKEHRYGDAHTPVVVTYHPAYLLRAPHEKRKAWEDLLFARSIVNAS